MLLNIIIVNYRTPKLVIDCLHSLVPEVEKHTTVITVVDNSSGDDSLHKINKAIGENKWSSLVKVIESPDNGGFSAGNNIGIKSVEADAYLLLNSDTIVRPGAINSLLQAMEAYPDVGLFSPRLEWPDGTPQISCFRYHSPVSELINSAATGVITRLLAKYNVPLPVSDQPFEPQWTSFACVLIRHKVIEQLGFMNEGYFMYFDDVDYCRRAQNAGWRILHFPESKVVHLRGGSGSVKADIASRKRPKNYLYASRTRYFTKFYGSAGILIANMFWLLGRGVSLFRELVNNKQPHLCQYEILDIWYNWQHPMKPFLLTKVEFDESKT